MEYEQKVRKKVWEIFGNQRLEYANRMEFIRVTGMTRSQLLQYIWLSLKTWGN